ncbi:MAG: NAD(P)/FAD-dependent oxidoreductase [Planctomycetes bacterium]|nr:NAD(P)/FAD-dependent oxidoreductase [Planctomycetota bacterium]
MENKNTDVVIVGAGPAGLIAGREIAKAGFKVIVVERKHSVCDIADFILGMVRVRDQFGVNPVESENTISYPSLGIELNRKETLLNGPQNGLTYISDKSRFGIQYEMPCYLFLDFRKIIEQLHAQAQKAGVSFITGTNGLELIKKGDTVSGVKCRDAKGEEFDIFSRMVIAADGLHSKLCAQAGLQRTDLNCQTQLLGVIYEGFDAYKVKKSDFPVNTFNFFWGTKYSGISSSLCYAVAINDTLQTAVGIHSAGHANPSADIRKTLEHWDSYLKKSVEYSHALKDAKISKKFGTIMPYSACIEKPFCKGFCAIGDSIAMIEITYPGALQSGKYAASCIIESLRHDDFSLESFKPFLEWWKPICKRINNGSKFNSFLHSLNDEEYDQLFGIMGIRHAASVDEVSLSEFVLSALDNLLQHPRPSELSPRIQRFAETIKNMRT